MFLGLTLAVATSAPARTKNRRAPAPRDTANFQAKVTQQLDDHERRLGDLEGTTFVSTPTRKAPAKSPSSTAVTHKVRAGESLSSIARRYGVSVAALQQTNGLKASTIIHPGQSLRLPGHGKATATAASKPPPAPRAEPTTPPPSSGGNRYGRDRPPAAASKYQVKPGDTIHALARRFQVSERELMRANGLSDPSKLRAGAFLSVPGHGAAGGETGEEFTTVAAGESTRPLLPEGWRWHTVGRGESLSQIAGRYGLERRSVEAFNQLEDGSASLYEGLELKIPPPGTVPEEPAPASRPRKGAADPSLLGYTVQKGDSLESLAALFHTSPAIIARLNHLDANAPLAAGSKLVVPNHLFE